MLDLDADEIVTPELAEEIRALFANGDPPHSSLWAHARHRAAVGEPWWNSSVVTRNRLYDSRQSARAITQAGISSKFPPA